MNRFEEVANIIDNIIREVQDKTIDFAATKDDAIVKMQVDQINQSLNASGEDIKPPYTPFTRRLKLRAGRSGRVDLRDKGDFLSEVTVFQHNSEIHIVSFDEKSKYLVPKYDPFGLMEKNLEKLRKLIFPELSNWFKTKLNTR